MVNQARITSSLCKLYLMLPKSWGQGCWGTAQRTRYTWTPWSMWTEVKVGPPTITGLWADETKSTHTLTHQNWIRISLSLYILSAVYRKCNWQKMLRFEEENAINQVQKMWNSQNKCPTSLKNKQYDKREGEESLEIAVGEKETQVCITQLQRTELV